MQIPKHELKYIFSRSGGKGGQNINKTETRVQVVWNVFASKILTDEGRKKILFNLKGRLTKDGDLIVVSAAERSQSANLSAGVHKLEVLVGKALKTAKIRHKTRPTRVSRLKRLEIKRKLSEKKRSRKLFNF